MTSQRPPCQAVSAVGSGGHRFVGWVRVSSLMRVARELEGRGGGVSVVLVWVGM